LQRLCAEINAGGVRQAVYFTHDVLSTEDVPALFQRACVTLGGLDLFVYNSGVQYPNDATVFSGEKDLHIFSVNLMGAAAWLNLAAERFERACSGHIVGVGSVAGDRGRRGMPAYTASKAGLHTYLEGWRNRVARHGVTVTTIKPGQVRTALLKNADQERGPISAEVAADLIWKAIKKRRATAYVPARWALVGLLTRHLPGFVFRRLNL
jgi:NAD(P)-dependent dehydrogenase (short-subunit alcohol dehydrogenase family)